METRNDPKVEKIYIHRYGVCKNVRGYAVATDVRVEKGMDGKGRLYYSSATELVYKNLGFALKKADSFVRRLHKDFIDFQGHQIRFQFENVGLLPECGSEAQN